MNLGKQAQNLLSGQSLEHLQTTNALLVQLRALPAEHPPSLDDLCTLLKTHILSRERAKGVQDQDGGDQVEREDDRAEGEELFSPRPVHYHTEPPLSSSSKNRQTSRRQVLPNYVKSIAASDWSPPGGLGFEI